MKHHPKCLKSQPPHDVAAPADVCRCLELWWLDAYEAKQELAETKAVLADLLEQRGESWLAQLAGRRQQLADVLRRGGYRSDGDAGCSECATEEERLHQRECHRGELARIVGGPEETQRQVDAAHEAALANGPGFNLETMRSAFQRVLPLDQSPPRLIGLAETIRTWEQESKADKGDDE